MRTLAVSFDGDGTLWDFDSSMRFALQQAANALSHAGLQRLDGQAIVPAWLKVIRDETARLPEYRHARMEDIRHASFAAAIRQCGSTRMELAETVLATYLRARFSTTALYADVRAALDCLKKTHRLALVTNGNTRPEQVGLGGVFDVVIIAAECGCHKPDPQIYTRAVLELSVAPEACLHVGDDPVEDVQAAQRAGLRTAWVNRASASWTLSSLPDMTVRELGELCGQLETAS